MLRIDRVVIHNFKSFKHANIGFSGGFNCIAGPNGSGKSNVCDSLLFALCEPSFKRMRVSSAAQLVNDRKEKSDTHTYVKVAFSGDRQFDVSREVGNWGTTYRLDGKAITRQELIDSLRENHCDINETNTITQGETARLASLNPRERRELIDIAAGIREFDIKREEAKKELEKVEGKMGNAQVMLNERLGFLQELAKEKEQAESYIMESELLRNMNYTLLKAREARLGKDYEEKFSVHKENSSAKEKCESDISRSEEEVAGLSLQKVQLSKELSESSLDASANTRALEQLGKEIALAESKLEAVASSKAELNERGRRLRTEGERMKLQLGENDRLIFISEAELQNMSCSGAVTDGEAERRAAEYKASQERIAGLSASKDSLEKDYSQISFDAAGTEKEAERLREELAGMVSGSSKLEEEYSLLQERLSKARGGIERWRSEAAKQEAKTGSLRTELSVLEAESINIREQLAMSGNSDKVSMLLSSSIKSGFYGRAGDLCSYDQKYALAVQAAGGQRFNYIIVESMKVAEQAIRMLKEKQAGRATFIPLEEVFVQQREKRHGGMESVLSVINFDGKFRKAFEYIFSGTYIVGSIGDAKKQGVGAARYVTLSGEIVETSGVVSGGSQKAQASAFSLNSKLKEVTSRIRVIREEISALAATFEGSREEAAKAESEMVKAEVEGRYTKERLEKAKSESSAHAAMVKEAEQRASKLSGLMGKLAAELDSAVSLLNSEKAGNARMYDALTKSLIGATSHEDIMRAKKERQDAEACKVRLAELNKENSMIRARLSEMEAEASEIAVNIERLSSEEKRAHSSILEKAKSLDGLKEKTRTYDKDTQEIYSRLKMLDGKVNSLSLDKGRLQGQLDRLNREILENETAKAQIEVRLGDIRAELSSYKDAAVVEKKEEELEVEIAISRRKLEELGPVNLKAPELYKSKKKDVEEAQGQISVLESEKDSVMAMIDEIESKKLNVFNQTLSAVNKNFKELYGYIFVGEAELAMEKAADPFTSGLVINMNDGKRKRHLDLLSGGEKTLVMLMMLLAIQMMHPMGFYIFDEIDASLDKENSKKLSMLVKKLGEKSQFIVVTHNDSMITSADTGIGVAMQNGESRAVGIAINR